MQPLPAQLGEGTPWRCSASTAAQHVGHRAIGRSRTLRHDIRERVSRHRPSCTSHAGSTDWASTSYDDTSGSASSGGYADMQSPGPHTHHHSSIRPHQQPPSSPSTGNRGLLEDEAAPLCQLECDTVSGLIAGASVRFYDSPTLRLRRRVQLVWEEGSPKRALIVKKPGVGAASLKLREIAAWLNKRGIEVFVEAHVQRTEFPDLSVFVPGTTEVDFAMTLGGDGTVLYLAALFQQDVPLPPTVCFAMGSLGFLTPFDANDYRACLTRVLDANQNALYCTLRARKRCEVEEGGHVRHVYHVLNECVIDRGSFPGFVRLEVFVDGAWVTTTEADGLIIATPSGSTAYSMSAGGSMVAPSVPCTLITPLSPHSLSFRPLVIAESSTLTVRLPVNARSHARASFDSKHPIRIKRGAAVHFTTSVCPLPLINLGTLDSDWYEGITQKLKWNQQLRQPQDVPLADTPEWQEAAALAAKAGYAASQEQHRQQQHGGDKSVALQGSLSVDSLEDGDADDLAPFTEKSYYVQ